MDMDMDMDLVVRVADVLDFNRSRRMTYERVVGRPIKREVAQNAFCLLLWMDTILGVEMLDKVAAMACDDDLMFLALEADAVYSFLVHDHEMPECTEDVPALVATCGGPLVDSRFFSFHRDLALRGLAALRGGVAALIFDDGLHAMMRELREADGKPSYRPPPALAAPYVVSSRTPPEDSRSAFICFTGGEPISQEEITAYFNDKWEGCIESVATEEAGSLAEPKHGIIVFADPVARDAVVNQENAASFDINGKSLWVQLYQPLS